MLDHQSTQEHMRNQTTVSGASKRKKVAKASSPPAPQDLQVLQVGAKLRHARRARGLKLKELSTLVGCSESMLSKIENEQAQPSLKMLHKIAAELDTSIGALFGKAGHEAGVVMRMAERPSIGTGSVGRPGSAGVRIESLLPDPVDKLLYASIHVVQPGGGSEGFIRHQGEEVGYVLEGELKLMVDGKAYLLGAGDSFFFASNLAHGYVNEGKVVTRVVWVNTPSTF